MMAPADAFQVDEVYIAVLLFEEMFSILHPVSYTAIDLLSVTCCFNSKCSLFAPDSAEKAQNMCPIYTG